MDIIILDLLHGYGAPGHNPGSGEKSVARAKALMDKKGQKGAPGLDAMMAANKEHKARRGVKKEELELDENRRAARAAGGYKDDSKKQNDPSKAGFTGIGNMSIDQIRKMSARMDKELNAILINLMENNDLVGIRISHV